jgi:dihydroorotase
MNDLVLKGGRVIDPAQGLDKVADVAFAGGKVAAIGHDLAGKDSRDVKGRIVTPGLIDLHTHVYWGGTSLGVAAELLARTGGVTTFIDAGSAGPGNFHGFRKHVIEPSPVRILPYLNVAFPGIYAFSRTVMVGECSDMRLIDAREAVRVAREHKDLVLGIKVRVGKSASGSSGIMPLDIALDVAEETGLPLMAHLDAPPPARHGQCQKSRRARGP